MSGRVGSHGGLSHRVASRGRGLNPTGRQDIGRRGSAEFCGWPPDSGRAPEEPSFQDGGTGGRPNMVRSIAQRVGARADGRHDREGGLTWLGQEGRPRYKGRRPQEGKEC